MNLKILYGLLPLLLVVGCMPLKQQEIISYSHNDFSALYQDGGYLLIAFGGELAQKQYVVNAEESYVTGPNQERYTITTQAHPYDVERGLLHPRVQILINNDKGKTIPSWGNGIWKLSLSATAKDGQRETVEQEFNLRTFYYSPFIHGAPN